MKEIRALLNYHGYGAKVDGHFGAAAESKVRAQKRVKIKVDGIVGSRMRFWLCSERGIRGFDGAS
ncbi:peptidoglycan-binding domain-containing protein [Streptomyces sp. NPDC085937]|uniref:peptidoglycan-binding domain-containing protein n=1 Tax=Streptomyces sp. NPDC085937 TaxID=3365742 RepID=UPI0037D22AAB